MSDGREPGVLARSERAVPDVTGVVFDMDGLLLDSEPVWVEAIDAFCQTRAVRYTPEDAAACMGRGIPFVADYLARTYRWALALEQDVDSICLEFAQRAPTAPACVGALELLTALRGRRPMALASSSSRPLVEAALGGRGWLGWFDAVVTGSDVTRLKPFPDIYLEATRRIGQEPARCVAFEDSPVGCQAATAAGLFVVGVPGLHGGRPSADVLASDLLAGARAVGLL